MKEVVILGSARTAGGKYGGTLQKVTAPKLGAVVIKDVIKRSGISADVIDQTVLGNAWQAGIGPNPARIAAVWGGIPVDKPAVSVNVRCGSSIQALIFGAQAIKAGDVDTVMVLFEDINGEPVYIAGDDDSGTGLNARIKARLIHGRTYYVRLRLYYAGASGLGAVMLWY